MTTNIERRIFHIHSWEDKNSSFGKHKTLVERGSAVEVVGTWDNASIVRSVTIPESGWRVSVTGVYRDSLLFGMKSPDKSYTADLRGWRNLPLHPKSLLGVGFSGFSGYTRDYVRAENWLAWQARRLKTRLLGK